VYAPTGPPPGAVTVEYAGCSLRTGINADVAGGGVGGDAVPIRLNVAATTPQLGVLSVFVILNTPDPPMGRAISSSAI
jgi:hypothetical protein